MTTVSMRMAKATTEDQDGAMKLYQLLNAIEGGNFLPESEDDDWPEFDADKKDDLVKLHEQLMEVFYAGGLMRVLMAAHAMLNPNNKLVDPDKDYLEFHPRFAAVEQQRDELLAVCKATVGAWPEGTAERARLDAAIANAEVRQ